MTIVINSQPYRRVLILCRLNVISHDSTDELIDIGATLSKLIFLSITTIISAKLLTKRFAISRSRILYNYTFPKTTTTPPS